MKKLLELKRARLDEIKKQVEASQDVNEVRFLGKEAERIKREIEILEAEIIEKEQNQNESRNENHENLDEKENPSKRSNDPNVTVIRKGEFKMGETSTKRSDDIADSPEYRKAFLKAIRTGKWDDANLEKRGNVSLTTDLVAKVIPNTILKEVIKDLKTYGQLYDLVRKMNVKGGVEIPISELKATAHWVDEEEVSETQAVPKINKSISFKYFIVEARISQTLLSQITSDTLLEKEISKALVEAFAREFDYVIINGQGPDHKQPLGVLNDERVPEDHKISFSETDIMDWTKFRTKLFAKESLATRKKGVFVTTVANWESYFMTLKDSNNRPVYSEAYDAKEDATSIRFNGRKVVLVENDVLNDYAAAEDGKAFAVYMNPDDYCINSNAKLGFTRYFNHDTNKWTNKGLAIVDGKLASTQSTFILLKGESNSSDDANG